MVGIRVPLRRSLRERGPGRPIIRFPETGQDDVGKEGRADAPSARYSRRMSMPDPRSYVSWPIPVVSRLRRRAQGPARCSFGGSFGVVWTAAWIAPVLFLAGCRASPKPAPPWAPRPLVHWKHLGKEIADPPRNGFRIVVPQPTTGLFPATIGVTRVALDLPESAPDEAAAEPKRRLSKDPRNEFLYWNMALDDQMAVSEVFPIDQFALGGGDADPDLVLAAFRGLHARLGLIYAVNELSEQETEVLGVLYATQTGQPLAYVDAHASSVASTDEDAEARDDLRRTDSKALARLRFERLVYDCVRELIQQDEPGPVEAPTGWSPVPPTQPVQWPPRNHRVQR